VDQLNRARPSILHLAGHGGPLGFVLEDDHGKAVDVTTDQLLRLISSADESLRLVVLNGCESAHQAGPIVQHVDAAIGMTRAIGDEAARVFAAQLYSSLGEGVALSLAFEQARLQISLAGIPEDQTPKLLVKSGRSADDMVFVR
jgi:CHAT domain-containing protein